MTDTSGFAKLVPGFDFLQGLAKSAGSAMPGMGQWIAPTLDPAEIEKRIEELRTVQFWLDQNSRLLSTTIQALEVQRMTLSTLKTMNVQMEGLRESLQVRVPDAAAPADAAPADPAAPGAVDPMRWWNALTQQFTDIATTALKETSRAAAAKIPASTAADAPSGAKSRPAAKAAKAASPTRKTTAPKTTARKKPSAR